MNSAQLSRLDSDVTVTDLEAIGTTIVNALRDDDNGSQRELEEAFDRKGNLLARIWPTQVEKARQGVAVRTMKEQAVRRAAMMELYSETRLEIARKQADALIASVGISLQVALAAFAAERITELSFTISEARNNFLASYGPAADQIELYKDRPELYSLAKEQLNQQLQMQFATLDQLLEGFVAHLNGRVVPQTPKFPR
jgi:hypothetical protein